MEAELLDYNDPGMHVTWLVNDTDAFPINPGPTSERDRNLHFGVNYREWFALYFDVLGVGVKDLLTNGASEVSRIAEFDEEIPDYPMLSRINGMLYDAVFESTEVDALRTECLRVQSQTTNQLALRGIEKLLRICDWALHLDLSIYLMCN
jgi:hypothetical protein